MRTSVALSSSDPDDPSVPADPPAEAPGSTSENPDDDQSSPSRPFQLTPKRKKAIEAVRFIAAHLKNEDDYAEVTVHEFISFLVHVFIQLHIYYTSTSVGGTL